MNPWELTDEEMRECFGDWIPEEQRNEAFELIVYDYMTELQFAAQAAYKSMVEYIREIGEPVEDSNLAPQKQKMDWLIPEDKWQALCKKLGVK